MVCIDRCLHIHVGARPEHRNIETSGIIPFLPGSEALSIHTRIGTAECTSAVEVPRPIVADRTAVRAVLEIARHSAGFTSPLQPKFQVILAHGLC